MARLELSSVSKRYGSFAAISDVSLTIEDGEFVVFVGPSGCGKSTLLRLVAGLDPISEGKVIIGDVDVTRSPAGTRGVAMVFQSYALYPHMTVFDNIAFPLQMERRKKDDIRVQVEKAAEIVQLTTRLKQKPAKLSGGQRQRVAIARAIVRKPKIFLMDEPLSNLDAALRIGMRTELTQLHQTLGSTIIYVTHDQLEAMTMADKIVVLNAGRVEQVGAPMELYHHPVNRFVAGFIGSPPMNMLDAKVISSQGTVLKLDVASVGEIVLTDVRDTLSPGDQVTIGVRPEFLKPDHADEDKAVRFDVVPRTIERLGAQTIIHAPANGQGFTSVFGGDLVIEPGRALSIFCDPSNIHVFDGDGRTIARC